MIGSSPRVWGQGYEGGDIQGGVTDHPHACGDKSNIQRRKIYGLGSSPRVWGQGYWNSNIQRRKRIIPTRVGTSNRCDRLFPTLWDHPHACGDKISVTALLLSDEGSSPRVWGQGCLYSRSISVERIIPTRVGTSLKEVDAIIRE